MAAIHDLAKDFVRLCREGQFEEAGKRYWSDRIVSLEPMDGPMARSDLAHSEHRDVRRARHRGVFLSVTFLGTSKEW